MTPSALRAMEEPSDIRKSGRSAGADLQHMIIARLFAARQSLTDESSALPARARRAGADVQRAAALLKLWKKKLGPPHAAAAARFKAASRHLANLEEPEKGFRRSTNAHSLTDTDEELAEIASLLRRCEVDGVVLVASLVDHDDLRKGLKKARQKARKRFLEAEDQFDHGNLERLRRAVRAQSALAEAGEPYFNGLGPEKKSMLETLERLIDRALGAVGTGHGFSPSSRKAVVREVLELGRRLYG